MRSSDVTDVLSLPRSQQMLDRDICRLAYVATEGTPRVVPVGFHWNGNQIVVCTPTNAPKVKHLRANPAVSLTIDTEVHPPLILLVRGRAQVLDLVDGIPDEYMQANKTYTMTPEQRVHWEAEVRSLYLQMVRVVITATWAKLIDFENTLPDPVAELVEQRAERQRSST